MTQINFLLSSNKRGLKASFIFSVAFIFIAFFLVGCEKKDSTPSIIESTSKKHFALLGPISNGDVNITIVDTNKIIYTTKTKAYDNQLSKLKWDKYDVGSFEVDFNNTIDPSEWVYIEITSGEDIDSDDNGIVNNSSMPLAGIISAYCKVTDLQNSNVIVNIFTTIGVEFYKHKSLNDSQSLEEYLNSFAKYLFVKSVDDLEGIDYRDIFSYVPNNTPDNVLASPNLYKNLLKYDLMYTILNDSNITSILLEDKDSDGLNLWDELLNDTSPLLADTDGDTIYDITEISKGLSPTLKDSDFDTIDDNDELLVYKTDPLSSDTDNDFIPDGVELLNASDMLNGDEDNNGVLDGLDGDPFFKYQWYIKSLGNIVSNTAGTSTIVGNDLDILDVYHKVLGNSNGKKSIIQVIDTGVELDHEDLDVDINNSFNAVTGSNNPTPTSRVSTSNPVSPFDVGHGSAVAGILAAKTNNSFGIRGIVPRARIAGSNWLEDQTLGELDRVWYSQINDDNIVVSNNSWGAYYLKDDGFERILAIATEELRNKKGRVFTFAGGNSREEYGNANLSYIANNPYVITVAAINHKDKYTTYSNPGSNILVSGYGGEHYYTAPSIMTTLLMGESYYKSELNGKKGAVTVDDDLEKNYTYSMNGTSSATPMVSGSIALVLDACPDLSWRDVKWLIANSATKIDKLNTTWVKNSAGLFHSIDYGYGKINPSKMIDMCRSKYYKKLPPMRNEHESMSNIGRTIPDNNTTIEQTINFSKSLNIEWIGLTIDTDHPFSGDLEISLISPSGTKTSIITPNETHFNGYQDGFRFGSVAFVDEDSYGVWKIEITDRLEDDKGILKSVKLEVFGYEK